MRELEKIILNTNSAEATERIGELIGQRLKGGEVIALASDLGGGKTTFVRGLARGLGSLDHVSSPTFKISNVYRANSLTLYHFDFYRLSDAGLMEHELRDVLADPKGIIVIEWADVIKHVLPDNQLAINFGQRGNEKRRLELIWPNKLAYLTEGLC